MTKEVTIKLKVTMSEDLWPYQVINEIQKVMEQGQRDGKRGWEKLWVSRHVHKAADHLTNYFLKGGDDEDHLAHAFTRIMMALAIERHYVKKGSE